MDSTTTETAAPATELPQTSRKPATVGRSLLFFDGTLTRIWRLVRGQPCVVTAQYSSPEEVREGEVAQRVNVNATFDGYQFPGAVGFVRGREAGNTFAGVPVYDHLTDEQRATLGATGTWCEWPKLES